MYEEYKVDVPEGASGKFHVERCTVTTQAADVERMRAMFNIGGRHTPEGVYTRLVRAGSITVMSDTPDEISDHMIAIHYAKGHILLNGLGLGIVLNAALLKPEVTKVTVIEIEPDVIALVGTHYQNRFGNCLEIIQSDALAYRPPKGIRYGMVWHDIWDNITSDNLPDMHKLHRKYGRLADWQGSWARDLCVMQRDQEKSYSRWW